MKICEKLECSFPNWYPKFKTCSLRSEIIPIPADVLEYLRCDIILIPDEATMFTVKSSNIDDVTYSNWDSDGDDEGTEAPVQPAFPEFSARIRSMMEKLGGEVFVKLNWSSPTDAAWIATNSSLKCTNLQDVYLLLKGSDKISKDLFTVCDRAVEHSLILKKWHDIHPGSEFRCFVKDDQLIAITQRDKSEFHSHIRQAKYDIVRDISKLFFKHIKNKFILRDFIFDVIWENPRVTIVDFNPFNDRTNDAYLFSWEELQDMEFVDGISPEFRYISEDVGIQPVNLAAHFGLPSDLTDMSRDRSRSIIELIQNNIDLQDREE